MRTLLVTLTMGLLALPVNAQYSGGTGEPNDPYQIATAADLIALGETPEDYDKHFVLTADIDLDPNLPGRKIFDRAVIASNVDDAEDRFEGTPFSGVFNGNSHRLLHITIKGGGYLGLFGQLEAGAEVTALGIVDGKISGSHNYVGGIAGNNWNSSITASYCDCIVTGDSLVGGLVGSNYFGRISRSYSTGRVIGMGDQVGGLAGSNLGSITTSYSTNMVTGREGVGGLVGGHEDFYGGIISNCYSVGTVEGNRAVGGLVGRGVGGVLYSVWDIERSGLSQSSGGVGLTTIEMMDPNLLALNGFAEDPNWILNAALDYPRLAWEGTEGQIIPAADINWLEGLGTAKEPHWIDTADQLIQIGKAGILWGKHFILNADLDLSPELPGRHIFDRAVIHEFWGVFDGNGHVISNLTVSGHEYLGLIGQLELGADVHNLGVMDVNVTGSGDYIGALAGCNLDGSIRNCYSTGSVTGKESVGGLLGSNYYYWGRIVECQSSCTVQGDNYVGGLVGKNNASGTITRCSTICSVQANEVGGGLVGINCGWDGMVATISDCYSILVGKCQISGLLVGQNSRETFPVGVGAPSLIRNCYAACDGTSNVDASGLVGANWYDGEVLNCFWDSETCGVANDASGGMPKSTAEMQNIETYLNAGWDFTMEQENGVCDIWRMPEEGGYPVIAPVRHLEGQGTEDDPYLVSDVWDLAAVQRNPTSHYRLITSIDLSSIDWEAAVIPWFSGSFDGNGYTISNLHISNDDLMHRTPTGSFYSDYLGLFGRLDSGAEVRSLGVIDVNIVGWNYIGGLAGANNGDVIECYSTGMIRGYREVGGLAGTNYGNIISSYCTGAVHGEGWGAGGLVGYNEDDGNIAMCYSTGVVTGNGAGGLVCSGGFDSVHASFWDIDTSGQTSSRGGIGLNTVELQTASTFLEAGWDFMGETANGTEDVWWILEGQDYPRLWWEAATMDDSR